MFSNFVDVEIDPSLNTSDPRIEDIIVSPCKKRPDSGEPCFLLDKPKNNYVCFNCGLIPGKGKIILSNQELERKYKAGEIRLTPMYNLK